MPSPVAVYPVYSPGADTSNLVTPVLSPTPVNGDILVIKLTTWFTTDPMGAVSGGAQTYDTRVTAAPGGFNGWARTVTCTVAGSPGAFAVTAAGTAGNTRHSMVVEHYLASQGAFLAAVPAVNATINGGGLPSATINTVGSGSVLSWCSTDVASVDPVGRVYLLSGTESGIYDGHVGANSVQYFAYATVGAAGAYNIGMSAPGGQTWVMAGVEVQFAPVATAVRGPVVVGRSDRQFFQPHPVFLARSSLEDIPVPPAVGPDPDFCAGPPFTSWLAGPPETGWDAGAPFTGWIAGPPEEC